MLRRGGRKGEEHVDLKTYWRKEAGKCTVTSRQRGDEKGNQSNLIKKGENEEANLQGIAKEFGEGGCLSTLAGGEKIAFVKRKEKKTAKQRE